MNEYLHIPFKIPPNVDETLTCWDNDEVGQAQFNSILDDVGSKYDDETNELRKLMFFKIFDLSSSHDLSAYICEDIGLIYYCEKINYINAWLQERREIYLKGNIPFNKQE